MTEPAHCVILGGGGHARVLIDCLQAGGATIRCAVLDMDHTLWGGELLGVPILGGDDLLPELIKQGASNFIVGVGSTRDNRPRKRLYEVALAYALKPVTVIHPTSVHSQSAEIGPGAQLLPSSIINAGARLGVNVIVNSGAIVEHDCRLGDNIHVATGAKICSTVNVGAEAHIGAGATIRQGLSIGEGAIVGAGAVVVEDVEPWTVVVGVPARPISYADLKTLKVK